MTTLNKFNNMANLVYGKYKMINALKKAPISTENIYKFVKVLPSKKNAFNEAYSKSLLKDPKLNAVAKKNGPTSPEYKAAVLRLPQWFLRNLL